jgi:cell division septal protein FtsQ
MTAKETADLIASQAKNAQEVVIIRVKWRYITWCVFWVCLAAVVIVDLLTG